MRRPNQLSYEATDVGTSIEPLSGQILLFSRQFSFALQSRKALIEWHLTAAGCAKYVQAPDVSWNKPFKALVTEQYSEWVASGVEEYIEAENI